MLDQHSLKCKHQTVTCEKCSEQMLKCDLKTHAKNHCPMRLYTSVHIAVRKEHTNQLQMSQNIQKKCSVRIQVAKRWMCVAE